MISCLTNLSNHLFKASREKLNISANHFGVNLIYSHDFEDLKSKPFYYFNKDILAQPKGLGYWLWKPYIILEAMKNLAEGDIVIYSDCGIEIIKNLNPLIKIAKSKEPIVLFANGNFSKAMWTKRDCFVLMGCDSEQFWESRHCDAAFCLFRKCDISLRFLNEWLNFAQDERILTDLQNTCGLPNLPEFIEHRWDQSILSLLAQKYNLNLYRMPSQFGNHYKLPQFRVEKEFNCINQLEQNPVNYYSAEPFYNSHYDQLLNHHREHVLPPGAGSDTENNQKTSSPAFNSVKNFAARLASKLKSS